MYPNAKNPSFGCFIEQLEESLQKNYPVKYEYAIRCKSGDSNLSKLISYVSWIIRVFWIGLTKEYDIIHAHTVFPGGVLALLVNLFKKKAILITIHGTDICSIRNKNFIFQWLARTALLRADSIQAVSSYIEKRVANFLPQSLRKTFVQCMGVDLSLFNPSPEPYLISSCANIIFVGNLVEKKGWREAFQAIEELQARGIKCQLNVYGNGIDFFRAREWIKERRLENSIILHGEKSRVDIVYALKYADLLLFPSRYNEAFSLVTAEALACGIPVVVSARGALPDLVFGIDGSFAVENIADAISLANACEASLNRSKSKIGKLRKSLLNSEYSLDESTKRLFDRYQNIVK